LNQSTFASFLLRLASSSLLHKVNKEVGKQRMYAMKWQSGTPIKDIHFFILCIFSFTSFYYYYYVSSLCFLLCFFTSVKPSLLRFASALPKLSLRFGEADAKRSVCKEAEKERRRGEKAAKRRKSEGEAKKQRSEKSKQSSNYKKSEGLEDSVKGQGANEHSKIRKSLILNFKLAMRKQKEEGAELKIAASSFFLLVFLRIFFSALPSLHVASAKPKQKHAMEQSA
jgi:hypothetical protein